MDDQDFIIDLTTLGHHIEHIEKYYQKAKWFSTSSTVVKNPTPTHVPTAEHTVCNIPSNPAIVRPTQIGYSEPPSNIPSNPLRQGVEYAQFQNPHMMHNTFGQPSPMMGSVPVHGGSIPIQSPFGQNQFNQPFGGGGFNIPIRYN
jgi:hypothetical protein